VGAALMICTLEMFPPIRRLFSGSVPAALGQLSFPIYLLHVLVICSVGSSVYLHFGASAAIATVFIVTLIAALPLVLFNHWWVARVNACVEFVLRAPAHRAASSRSELAPKADARSTSDRHPS